MRIIASKTLPHRENGPPAGTPTHRPRTAPRQGSRPLTNGRRPRSGISHLASVRANAPEACFPLAGSRGTATGQWPRRLGLSLAVRLWRMGRLGAWDGPTLRRRGRGFNTGAVGGRLPLLPLKRPAWSLLWCSRLRGVGVGSRRTHEDPVKTGRHPLGVVAIVVTIATIVLIRGLFLRFPPLPGFRSARFQRLALEVLLLLLVLFKSNADFCFSADSRRLSRSTSSSCTGGLEDRTSIDPCVDKDKP